MFTSPDDLNTNKHKTPTKHAETRFIILCSRSELGSVLALYLFGWMMYRVPSADMLVCTKF